MNILVAASEAIPYAKTGGLADVTGALPQELAKLGHNVILLLPRYRSLDESGRRFRVIARLPVPTPQGDTEAVIEEDIIRISGNTSVRVWALRQDKYFDRAGVYQEQGKDYPDNLERFTWFSRAVVEALTFLNRETKWKTDILHLHDWQTALCAVYQKTVDRDRREFHHVKSVLTLHNVGYQGIFPGHQFDVTGLPPASFVPEGLEFYGSINLLKGGIIHADYLTTVSPTYAKEILTPKFGFGLEGVLQRRGQLEGIINGIDTDRWNPALDRFLPVSYSAGDRAGKAVCKRALQHEFGLRENEVPMLAAIARLTPQKGVDLLETIIPRLMESDLQLAILGAGDPNHEENLRKLRSRFPSRIGLHIGFDEGLAHRIEAGADIFLMPSRYEPCGLSQLYSLRYGTVPVVTKTGGLADTVVPVNPETLRSGTATGYHVESPTAEKLLSTVLTAVGMYSESALWERIIQTGMNTDVSWANSATIYERLFCKLSEQGA
ncbi:MAG TPA: glycogen synthase GlgA [Nitrospira sp.]|nr:glycogen synthase GlgA [Nitrospira sp.]